MKKATREAIGTFQRMATKPVNGVFFSSWRTPDNKRFFLAPAKIDINVIEFGCNPDAWEVSYTLLGILEMVK